MLYLSRKVGESIVINNNITLMVKEVRGKTVKIGFAFPPEASILRKEVYDRIKEENAAAIASEVDLFDGEIEFSLDDIHVDSPDEKTDESA